jgi:hypothetical protein
MLAYRNRAVNLLGLVVATWFLVATSLPGQRAEKQGDVWMKWNQESRKTYILGYMAGYSTAYAEACRRVANEGGATSHCMEQQLEFSQDPVYYVKNITDLYTRYPDDRDIYLQEAIEQLSKGRTIEEIHSHPFRRRSPKAQAVGTP